MSYISDLFAGSVQYGKRIEMCEMLTSIQDADIKQQLPVIKQYATNQGLTVAGYDRKVL